MIPEMYFKMSHFAANIVNIVEPGLAGEVNIVSTKNMHVIKLFAVGDPTACIN